jgi:hypothetical protein
MKLYYRISDNSYKKDKLIGATKEICLINFVKAFHEIIFGPVMPPLQDFIPPMKIIADKCEDKTIAMLHETGIPVVVTNYGNAGSLKYALDIALEECKDDEVVYFVEDDYLHLGSAPKLLEEGIKRADYVTLYDHPDKYTPQYNGGEYSKVIRTASSHWRYTISTCMTFATKVKTLREDYGTWAKFIDGIHPHDHQIFTELNKDKRRRLAVCIPGVACHCDLEYSQRVQKMLIEPWAIDLVCDELLAKINPNHPSLSALSSKKGLEKLMLLHAIVQLK